MSAEERQEEVRVLMLGVVEREPGRAVDSMVYAIESQHVGKEGDDVGRTLLHRGQTNRAHPSSSAYASPVFVEVLKRRATTTRCHPASAPLSSRPPRRTASRSLSRRSPTRCTLRVRTPPVSAMPDPSSLLRLRYKRSLTRCMREHLRLRHVPPPPYKLVLHRHARAQTHAPMVVLAALPLRPPEVVHHRVAPAARVRGVPARHARDLALAPLPVADDKVLQLIAVRRGAPPVRVEPRVFRADACAGWKTGLASVFFDR